jgi:hypothetical protein
MSSELTHADLQNIVTQITGTVRHEVQLARTETANSIRGIHDRLEEMRDEHATITTQTNTHGRELAILSSLAKSQDDRIDLLQIEKERHGERIAALEALARLRRVDAPSPIPFTGKQKAAIGSMLVAAATAALEIIRQWWGKP